MTDDKTKLDMKQMLAYLKPILLFDRYNNDYGLKYRRMADIASGKTTTKLEWDERYYKGDSKPSSLRKWLEQFDDSWDITSGWDADIYAELSREVPLTQEEIDEAKAYMAEHGDVVETYIKFLTPCYGRSGELLNLPSEDEE